MFLYLSILCPIGFERVREIKYSSRRRQKNSINKMFPNDFDILPTYVHFYEGNDNMKIIGKEVHLKRKIQNLSFALLQTNLRSLTNHSIHRQYCAILK